MRFMAPIIQASVPERMRCEVCPRRQTLANQVKCARRRIIMVSSGAHHRARGEDGPDVSAGLGPGADLQRAPKLLHPFAHAAQAHAAPERASWAESLQVEAAPVVVD